MVPAHPVEQFLRRMRLFLFFGSTLVALIQIDITMPPFMWGVA